MKKTIQHLTLEELMKSYNNTFDEIKEVLDKMSPDDKKCICGDELDMGKFEYDIERNEFYEQLTVTMVCMSCGGIVNE